jgi:hypothetical protein
VRRPGGRLAWRFRLSPSLTGFLTQTLDGDLVMPAVIDPGEGVVVVTTPANPFVPKGMQPGETRSFSQQVSPSSRPCSRPSRISPAPWLFGAGPSFIFPTASNSRLGQNKWQIGPAGVFAYAGDKWLAGVFPQQWFSVGGPGPQTISQMNLQYFFVYLPGHGWGVGTSPNMLVNWYASDSNKVTFPIGLNISKVVWLGPLPVKFLVQGNTCRSIQMWRGKSGTCNLQSRPSSRS